MGYMGNNMGNVMYPTNEYGYNAAQDRLNMMEQQRYGMQGQGMGMQNGGGQVQMQVFKGRPVTNFYEANASLIDLDGSLHIFPDFANNRIYTKKITLDGTADLKTYALTDNPVDELRNGQSNNPSDNPVNSFVGRSEFESHMKAMDERLNYFMGRIEGILGGMVNGNQYGRNDATVPTVQPDAQSIEQSSADGTTSTREQSTVREGATDGKRKNR